MRRRIASRVISVHDVCRFCALHPSVNAPTYTKASVQAVRHYNSSTITKLPASSAAAKTRDEGSDDPPMLRRNLDLASSFPIKRQNATISPIERESTSSPTSTGNRNARQPRPERDSQSDAPTFRNNFGSFPRKSNAGQANRSQGRGSNITEPLNSSDGVRQNQKQERRFGRFDGQSQSRQRTSTGQPTAPNRSDMEMRRFVLDRQPAETNEDEPQHFKTFSSRPSRDNRPSGRPQSNLRQSQQQDGTQDRSSTFRRITFDGSNQPTTPVSGRTRNTEKPRQSDGRQASIPETVVEDEDIVIESIEAPAGTSFDASNDIGTFHHRRGQRQDKRKSRSARLEIDDPDENVDSTQVQSRAPPSHNRGSGGRDRAFDYEMAEAEEALYGDRNRRKKKGKPQKVQETAPVRPSIRISEFMSVGQLSNVLGVPLEPFIATLEQEGFEGARYDNILDAQTSSMFADLYGFEPIVAVEDMATDLVARPQPDDVSVLPPRPPIVTIMGHVDHGKTTILDYLRKSSVVATEHGGITQHIGAFSVTMPGTNRQITFLDTPGHAAFLEMRRRGANVTDIVVLVVAADDSVKPQTIEAIKHAIEANVQIIVAINKVDKEDANIERVKQDLTRHDIVVEDYGGDFQAIPVSGKTGQGMDELEEAIITLADVHDFRAETDGPAEGTIIESKVTAAGRVATVLVRRGTLRPSDFIVAGTTWARVRTLRDDTGELVTEAPPGTPVQVDGWRGEDPTAGLEVLQAETEEQAKSVIDFRMEREESLRASMDITAINEARNEEADARAKTLAWEAEQEWAKRKHGRRPKDNAGWVEPEAADGPKQVHFIVKADVAGSVEAVVASVAAVGTKEVTANVVHSGTGQVTESDIRMLATTGETGYIISFNQSVDGTMYRLAEAAGLQILDYNIIYQVTDVVKEKLAEQLPPIVTQKVLGEAEVGQIFEVTVKKNKIKIAGCKITNGTISRANKVRVLRSGSEVYTGTLHSLKNVKKDVTEMRKGTECGMGFDNWDDFREGDQVQCFDEHEEKRTLY